MTHFDWCDVIFSILVGQNYVLTKKKGFQIVSKSLNLWNHFKILLDKIHSNQIIYDDYDVNFAINHAGSAGSRIM